MVAARSSTAWLDLSGQFKAHSVRKIYDVFVLGIPEKDCGEITLPVFRNPKDRKKMAAGPNPSGTARHAETYWHVAQRFSMASRLKCFITTGRTHQIRVHLCAIGFPVMGDLVYGTRKAKKIYKNIEGVKNITAKISRQMLHAGKIAFTHPYTRQTMEFTVPMPKDMQILQKALEDFQSR
jgi:23S rRNA pseudouridine1911/1915/1917 synthase